MHNSIAHTHTYTHPRTTIHTYTQKWQSVNGKVCVYDFNSINLVCQFEISEKIFRITMTTKPHVYIYLCTYVYMCYLDIENHQSLCTYLCMYIFIDEQLNIELR